MADGAKGHHRGGAGGHHPRPGAASRARHRRREGRRTPCHTARRRGEDEVDPRDAKIRQPRRHQGQGGRRQTGA